MGVGQVYEYINILFFFFNIIHHTDTIYDVWCIAQPHAYTILIYNFVKSLQTHIYIYIYIANATVYPHIWSARMCFPWIFTKKNVTRGHETKTIFSIHDTSLYSVPNLAQGHELRPFLRAHNTQTCAHAAELRGAWLV